MRVHFALLLQGWKVVRAVQHLASGLDPIVVEGCLQLRHYGPLNAEVSVWPVLGIATVASPMIRDAYPSAEPDATARRQPA